MCLEQPCRHRAALRATCRRQEIGFAAFRQARASVRRDEMHSDTHALPSWLMPCKHTRNSPRQCSHSDGGGGSKSQASRQPSRASTQTSRAPTRAERHARRQSRRLAAPRQTSLQLRAAVFAVRAQVLFASWQDARHSSAMANAGVGIDRATNATTAPRTINEASPNRNDRISTSLRKNAQGSVSRRPQSRVAASRS